MKHLTFIKYLTFITIYSAFFGLMAYHTIQIKKDNARLKEAQDTRHQELVKYFDETCRELNVPNLSLHKVKHDDPWDPTIDLQMAEFAIKADELIKPRYDAYIRARKRYAEIGPHPHDASALSARAAYERMANDLAGCSSGHWEPQPLPKYYNSLRASYY